jgi:hypothetical protein
MTFFPPAFPLVFSFSSFFSSFFSAFSTAFSTAAATFFFVPVATAFAFVTRPEAGARGLDVLALPCFLPAEEYFLAAEAVAVGGPVVVVSEWTRWVRGLGEREGDK